MGGPNQQEGRPPPECCTRVRGEEIVFGTELGYLKNVHVNVDFHHLIKFKFELKHDSYIVQRCHAFRKLTYPFIPVFVPAVVVDEVGLQIFGSRGQVLNLE